MKIKQRISHCNTQSTSQDKIHKEICHRVKQKLDEKVKRRNVELVERKQSNKENAKAPKKNQIYNIEAAYAAPTRPKTSLIVSKIIEVKAKEFREISKKAPQKKKFRIRPVNWQNGEKEETTHSIKNRIHKSN